MARRKKRSATAPESGPASKKRRGASETGDATTKTAPLKPADTLKNQPGPRKKKVLTRPPAKAKKDNSTKGKTSNMKPKMKKGKTETSTVSSTSTLCTQRQKRNQTLAAKAESENASENPVGTIKKKKQGKKKSDAIPTQEETCVAGKSGSKKTNIGLKIKNEGIEKKVDGFIREDSSSKTRTTKCVPLDAKKCKGDIKKSQLLSQKKFESNEKKKLHTPLDDELQQSDSDFEPPSKKYQTPKTANVKSARKSAYSSVSTRNNGKANPSKHQEEVKEQISVTDVVHFDDLPAEKTDFSTVVSEEKPVVLHAGDQEDSGSDSGSDWEEVEDLPAAEASPIKSQIPDKPVEITLEGPSIMRKKRKKKFDLEAWYRRQMNRFQKEVQQEMHKTHLLCLIAYGFHRNKVCNDHMLKAVCLSITPTEFVNKDIRKYDVSQLTRLVRWYTGLMEIDAELQEDNENLEETLLKRVELRKVASEAELVYLFVLILRSLGAEVRLIFSLQPITHKAVPIKKLKPCKKNPKESENSDVTEISPGGKEEKGKATAENITSSKSKVTPKKCKLSKSERELSPTLQRASPEPGPSKPKAKSSNSKTAVKKSDRSNEKARSQKHKSCVEMETPTSSRMRKSSRRKCALQVKKTEVETVSDSGSDSDEEFVISDADSESDEDWDGKKGKGKRKKKNGTKEAQKKGQRRSAGSSKDSSKSPEVIEVPRSNSPDSDFEVQVISYRKSPVYSTCGSSQKKGRSSILSSDSDDSVKVVKSKIKNQGTDQWMEIYIGSEKRWICVDCVRGRVDKPAEMETHATKPLCYILSFNSRNHVKDLTSRYAADWMSRTRKLRIDEDWWKETLEPYHDEDEAEREEEENLQIQAQLMQKPMPTSIGDFKNHPLYALKRHLLKFEAIYPVNAPPLGFVRGEPVYARECVRTLHSRENWLQEARLVRLNEEPYKIVKARVNKRKHDRPLEEPTVGLYGYWQTEDYIPPPAVDGKVPRNEYGNVELFKPSMLPAGTVQLRLPGLNKVAKKLNLDCVPAMVGWDHHCGFSHPVLDGFIVCVEHEEILTAAWEQDQQTQREKELKKREERVLKNWVTLVKAVLIKERLKKKYDLHTPEKAKGKSGSGDRQKAEDVSLFWPRNRQDEQPSTSSDRSHLFPFEEM